MGRSAVARNRSPSPMQKISDEPVVKQQCSMRVDGEELLLIEPDGSLRFRASVHTIKKIELVNEGEEWTLRVTSAKRDATGEH